MPGIWISSDEWHEFSAQRRELLSEVATRQTAEGFDPAGWLGLLPDPDPVLLKSGHGMDALDELTADDQVLMAMQSRKLQTLEGIDYRFQPGAAPGGESSRESARVRDQLVADLEDIDLYTLISQVLDAPFYGFTPVELLWEAEGGKLRLRDAVAKPREWFGFEGRNQLAFNNMGVFEPVPEGKFCVARHFPSYKNPYGLRLLSRCLWPVSFKKGGARFWMQFAERYGLPWVVGKAREGADQGERREMLSALSSMVQDAVAVVSGGSEVEVHETSGRGSDVHKSLVETWNAAISKVLMGQTLSAEVGQGGSYAAAKTHSEVLGSFSKADKTLVKSFFEQLSQIYTRLNAPGGTPHPTFAFIDSVDYQSMAEVDEKLYQVGVRFRKKHFARHYNLAEDEFDVPGPDGAEHSAPSGAEYAEGENEDGQDQVEDLARRALREGEPIAEDMARRIMEIIEESGSFEEVQAKLARAMPELDASDFEDLMQRALVAADIWGRYTTGEE